MICINIKYRFINKIFCWFGFLFYFILFLKSLKPPMSFTQTIYLNSN